VPGTAGILTREPDAAPLAAGAQLATQPCAAKNFSALAIKVRNWPRIEEPDRCLLTDLALWFTYLRLDLGFIFTPNNSDALILFRKSGLRFDVMSTGFHLGRRRFVCGAAIGSGRFLRRV